MRLLRLPHLRILPALTAIVIALAACGASARQKTISTTLAVTNAAADAFVVYDQGHRAEIVTQATSHAEGVAKLNDWDTTTDKVQRDLTAAYKAIATAATLNDDPSLLGMVQAATIVKTELETLGILKGAK